ncbi:MAG: hypothetical protein IJT44_03215 [Clostridia bacterium]|nr:hypothetical protein [Clostridia bacterium]
MKKIMILLLAALMLLGVAACGKKTPQKDPNAVLTDSDVPLDLGAEVWDFEGETGVDSDSF